MSEDLIVPFWQGINDTIETDILHPLRENFLEHPAMRAVAFSHDGTDPRFSWQLNYLVERRGKTWVKETLRLEEVTELGMPAICDFDSGIQCSPNMLQTLFHLVYWEEQTGLKITDMETIYEWGGGYGAMARLIFSLHPSVKYILVDTPTFAELQYQYLSWMLPQEADYSVHNIYDFAVMDAFHPDLIISTWALSESSSEIIKRAACGDTFRSTEHFLLAFQANQEEFESAGDIVTMLNKHRQDPIDNVTPVPYWNGGGNWYASR